MAKTRKPRSPEAKASQALAMREYWAKLTSEQRQEVALKISAKVKGQKRSPEQVKRISDSQKGKKLTPEHRAQVSQGLKVAYAEGRKQPVRSSHRKGATLSIESRSKISTSLKGNIPWNKGVSTGPRPEDVCKRISESTKGHPDHIAADKKVDWKMKIAKAQSGKRHTDETRAKMSFAHAQAWGEGRRRYNPNSGYGKGCFYESPFQGAIWLRSSSERQRAEELDAVNAVWFHEAIRYPLTFKGAKASYTPDFWIVQDARREDVPSDVVSYLNGLNPSEVQIEDVKGYWKPTHRTFPKITAFQEQYPNLQFKIVIREGLK